MDAVLAMHRGARLDRGVVDAGAGIARLQPARDALVHLAADSGVAGIGAEVAQLLGIVREVEQHGSEALPPNVLPAFSADHDGPAVTRSASQSAPCGAEGII